MKKKCLNSARYSIPSTRLEQTAAASPMAQHPELPPPCPDRQNTRTQRRSRHCSRLRPERPPGKRGGEQRQATKRRQEHHQCRGHPHCHQNYKKKGVYPVTSFLLDTFHGIMKLLQWPNVPLCPIYSLYYRSACCTKFAQQLEASHANGSTKTTSVWTWEAEAPAAPAAPAIHVVKSHSAIWAVGPAPLEPPTAWPVPMYLLLK